MINIIGKTVDRIMYTLALVGPILAVSAAGHYFNPPVWAITVIVLLLAIWIATLAHLRHQYKQKKQEYNDQYEAWLD